MGKIKPQGIKTIFFELQIPEFTILFLNFEKNLLALDIYVVIKQITHDLPVDGQDAVARFKLQFLADASPIDA